jgi:streptogramin lyase
MNVRSGMRPSMTILGAIGVALVAAATVSPAPTANSGSLSSRAVCGSGGMQSLSTTTGSSSRPRRKAVGRIVAVISTSDPEAEEDSDPHGVAFGEGSVWVADRGLQSVLRINPARNRIAVRISVPGTPSRLAVGAGSVWVTQASLGSLARIDIASQQVVATIPLGGGATGQPALGAGSVWALDGTNRQVVRIDPATNTVVARIDIGGTGPIGGLLFAYNSVWAASDGDAQVVRIDPATNAVTARVALRRGSRRPRLTMDPQTIGRGAVWIANTDVTARGYHTIATVNAASMTADPKRVPVVRGDLVGLVRVGRSIWVTDDSGALWRIDAVRRTVLGRVAICAQTAYVAAGAGSVWAIDPMGGSLVRVRPRVLH